MAKQKTLGTLTAKIANEDLSGLFRFDRKSDGYGGFTQELVFILTIDTEEGETETVTLWVDDELTSGERTSLNQLLVKLRDAGLLTAGYIDV